MADSRSVRRLCNHYYDTVDSDGHTLRTSCPRKTSIRSSKSGANEIGPKKVPKKE